MILRNKQADDFIKNPSDDIQGILLHGQDSGLINYRTKALVSHYIPNKNDPFLLSTINILDELRTKSEDRRISILK